MSRDDGNVAFVAPSGHAVVPVACREYSNCCYIPINESGDPKAAASSAMPLSIHLIEADLICTRFFGVFFSTPNVARQSFHAVLVFDTERHDLGVFLRIVFRGRIRRIFIRPCPIPVSNPKVTVRSQLDWPQRERDSAFPKPGNMRAFTSHCRAPGEASSPGYCS